MRGVLAANNESVSCKPLPPLWAWIKSDPILPKVPIFETSSTTSTICLDDDWTCCCKTPQPVYSPFQAILTRECIIYGLTEVVKTTIEVQNCLSCKHHFVGPDCQSIDVLNWNNQTLATHELLDNYTNQFTTSETPFIAWVNVISRCYEARDTAIPFMSDWLFCAIWFSYITISKLRHLIQAVLNGPLLLLLLLPDISNLEFTVNTIEEPSDSETSASEIELLEEPTTSLFLWQIKSHVKNLKAMNTYIKLIPNIINDFLKINVSLSQLFDWCYGPVVFMTSYWIPVVYKKLILQVSNLLSIELLLICNR